jgi:hypothetical protein
VSGGVNYVTTFNATTDWGSPSGGLYTLTITAATHGKGTNPSVEVLEQNGLVYQSVGVTYILNASGDVSIEVLQTPNNRFAGKLIIS